MLSFNVCFSEDGVQLIVVCPNGFMSTCKYSDSRDLVSSIGDIIHDFDDLYEHL